MNERPDPEPAGKTVWEKRWRTLMGRAAGLAASMDPTLRSVGQSILKQGVGVEKELPVDPKSYYWQWER